MCFLSPDSSFFCFEREAAVSRVLSAQKPNTWAFGSVHGCQLDHLVEVPLLEDTKSEMRSHGFRNQQETSISQMLKCELLLLFMSIILPSLYWELDPRSPINCTASLAVLDPVRLVLLLARGWGEALDLLLTAPTLCLPRDPLAALRSGFHS